MLSVKGIYDGEKLTLLENIVIQKPRKVIVTFVEEDVEVRKVREYSADQDAFEFWTASEEDLYQDYLQSNK